MAWKQSEAADVTDTPAIHEGEGVITRRRFFRDTTRLPVRVEIWELPPGASEGSHIHDGDDALEEFYYFIEGQGVMWMNGQEMPVRPGDAVMAPPGGRPRLPQHWRRDAEAAPDLGRAGRRVVERCSTPCRCDGALQQRSRLAAQDGR